MINDFDDSEFAKTRKTIVIFSFTILLSYIGFIDFTELKFISDNDAKIETVRLMMIVGLIVLNIKFYFQLNEHKKGYLNFEALSNLEGKISGLITATEKVRKDFTKYKSDEPSYDDSLISNFNGAVQCMEELSKIHKPDGKLAIQNIDNLFENIIRTEIKSSPLSENQIKEIVKNIKRIFEVESGDILIG